MTITTNTTLAITPDDGFTTPLMDQNPLLAALRNSNHLYRSFAPPAASVAPLDGPLSRASTSYVFPVRPSADGIGYSLWHRLKPGATGTVDIKVETNTGTDPTTGWSTAYGPTTTASMTSGVWATVNHSVTIGATVRMLRVTYSALGSVSPLLLSHLLLSPAPGAPTSGLKACGFLPFDEALLTDTSAPVCTEMLDRAQANAYALLYDRTQMVASLVQPYDTAPAWLGHAAGPSWGPDWPMRLGRGSLCLPWQTKATVEVQALAFVSGGSVDALIEVVIGGRVVMLDASGQLVTSTEQIELTGGHDSSATVQVRVRSTVGNTTYLAAMAIIWRPGD